MEPMGENSVERLLNRTWRPALSVTGIDGIPPLDSAGNVLRPHTALKLSMRLPPTLDGDIATKAMKKVMDAYGRGVMYMGEGGTIPFMAMLGEAYPEAQFVITGVLGPKSNAHGPNEFLHIPFVKKLTTCVAQVLADHNRRND
jgi:acetylornithine deacetylase/succinyl-diaminopimelate desuccinylase-like protein